MSKLVILIVNNTDLIDPFLYELSEQGIKGATIFESKGMGHELGDNDDYPLFTSLIRIMGTHHSYNKSIFIAVHEDQVEKVKQIVKEKFGDMQEENSGIMMILPIDEIQGLKF